MALLLFSKLPMSNSSTVHILLRLSVASVFLYAAIAATLEPYNWIGYLPQQLRNMFPAATLLHGFSLYEFLLAVWVLSGWKTFYAAILSSITFLGIIGANYAQLDVLFRDFAIFFSSLALAFATKDNNKHT